MNFMVAAGNIGQDPRHNSVNGTNGPVSVLNFSLGITEHSGGGKSTLWVDCALWGKRADALQPYLSKGSKVTVQGPVSLDAFKSEKSGEVVPKLKLNVREITLQGGGQQSGQGQAPAGGGEDMSDIPFAKVDWRFA